MVDLNAAELGVSQIQLMESSGHAVAREVKKIAAGGEKIAIIGGRGNNGGDAFVSARFLKDFEVKIYFPTESCRPLPLPWIQVEFCYYSLSL